MSSNSSDDNVPPPACTEESALVSIPNCGVVSHDLNPPATGNEDSTEVNGCKIDALGPIILNSDGSMGRISNWTLYTDSEKEQAMRLIAARNKRRKAALLEEQRTKESSDK